MLQIMFLIMDMTNILGEAVGLVVGDNKMNVSIHEDNYGAFILTETLPPRFNPWSKHCDSKTIWFCKDIHKHGVNLKMIATMDQQGDISTKGLTRVGF